MRLGVCVLQFVHQPVQAAVFRAQGSEFGGVVAAVVLFEFLPAFDDGGGKTGAELRGDGDAVQLALFAAEKVGLSSVIT